MNKPKLLDLFCGAGGCSMGYHRAGFEVVGVDKSFQKRYPFPFIQADALQILSMPAFLAEFDVIHASPPCQLHSCMQHLHSFKPERHEDLIEPVRKALIASGKPYVIENVPGAPLVEPFTLCGTMFGLRTDCGAELRRHRLFETNWFDDIFNIPQCMHYADRTIGVVGSGSAMTGQRSRCCVVGGKGQNRAVSQQNAKRCVTVTGHTSNDWSAIRNRRKSINVTGHNGKSPVVRETFPIEQARIAMGIEWMSGKELSQSIPPAYTEFIGRHLMEYLTQAASSNLTSAGVCSANVTSSGTWT